MGGANVKLCVVEQLFFYDSQRTNTVWERGVNGPRFYRVSVKCYDWLEHVHDVSERTMRFSQELSGSNADR